MPERKHVVLPMEAENHMKQQSERSERTMYALAHSTGRMDGISNDSGRHQMLPGAALWPFHDHASRARTGPLTVVGLGGRSEGSPEWPWWLCELVSILADVALSLVFG